ncbi:MAG: hypothetical protein H6Q67_904 [Firmicutes bacterium]|nr:hypothetical protein [Bacillota bacterium]
MSKRKRNLRLHIMVSHEELAAIQERMKELGSQSQSAFIRKMAIDGYAVNVDLAPLPHGKILKQGKCVHTCPACRLAEYRK